MAKTMKTTTEYFAWSENEALMIVEAAREDGYLHAHTIQKKIKKDDEFYIVKITEVKTTVKDILEGEMT